MLIGDDDPSISVCATVLGKSEKLVSPKDWNISSFKELLGE